MSHSRGHGTERNSRYDFDELGLRADDEYYGALAEKENNDYEEDEFM